MSLNNRPSIHAPTALFLEDDLCQEARDVLIGASHALELIEEAATITLPDRRFIYVNAAFEQLYGFTSASMLGRVNLPIHTRSVPDQLIECIFTETLSGGWRGELENKTRNGKLFDIALRTKPLKTSTGRVVGYLGICHPTSWQRVPLSAPILPEASVVPDSPYETRSLSARERDVIAFYGLGLNTKEIAAKLNISPPSVFTYRSRISEKLGLKSPADFYRVASQYAKPSEAAPRPSLNL
jgi:PAS domain S-box-containing protein